MTALLEHFHEAVNTPEDVEKLKMYILQLAMQGRLVEQDTNDEPALELMKKIEAEKQRLIKEKLIKKAKALPSIEEDEKPYQLPKSWMWVRLNDIGFNHGQKKPDEPFSYIDVSSIDNKNGKLSDNINILSPEEAPSRARKIIKKGTVIYSTVRPYLLNIAIIDREFDSEPIASTAFAIVHPFEGVSNKFLYHYLRSPIFIEYVESKMIGVAYPAINDTQFFSGLLPLPPINEQVRIVNTIEKLFEQCDQLHFNIVSNQTTSILLNKSIFTKIQDHGNPNQLNDLRFALENMEHLCNNNESITQLRNSILSLAIQGKLVEQDDKDEPASKLLEKIKEEKERLITEKKIKKEKPLPPVSVDEIPYVLPKGWQWVRFADICSVITCGYASTPNYVDEGKPFLSAKNVKPYKFLPDDHKFISDEDYYKLTQNAKPEVGDILLTRVGAGIGESAIIDREFDFAIYVSLTLIKPIKNLVNEKYLLHWLNSPEGTSKSIENTYGKKVSQGNLNVNQVRKFAIPLPPLAEQKRIVDKLDTLISYCYEIENRILKSEKSRNVLNRSLISVF